jgi:SAM-dependent methyltransferase
MPVLPTLDEIAHFYAEYNRHYTGGGASEGRNLARYAKRYLEIVQRYVGSGQLIDIGSSNNPFPNEAARAGFSTTAVDFARPSQLSADVDFICGNLNEAEPPWVRDAAFDVVTSWAVLEHVPDTHAAAALLARLCKPGGVIIVSTPEVGTWLTRRALGRSPWFYPPEHLTLISPDAFRLVFERSDCRLVHWGRLEISPLRYLARYGIGVLGAIVGTVVKALAPRRWRQARDQEKQRFQGVTYFVFRKGSA